MQDNWTGRLSEYLDGDLAKTEQAELNRHLAGCGDCREALEELRGVRTRAQQLEDRLPDTMLWSGIAARIGGEAEPHERVLRPPRDLGRKRVTLSVPQLMAAGIALMVISGGAVQLVHTNRDAVVSQIGEPVGDAPGVLLAGFDMREYDLVIAELQAVLEERRSVLAPATVRALEQNLGVIDRAITEATDALARDPSNEYVAGHLAKTLKQKVRLLQRVVTMPRTAS